MAYVYYVCCLLGFHRFMDITKEIPITIDSAGYKVRLKACPICGKVVTEWLLSAGNHCIGAGVTNRD